MQQVFNLMYSIISNIIYKLDHFMILGVSFLDISITILILGVMIDIFVAKSKGKDIK